jgi:uncharacterized membrane protein
MIPWKWNPTNQKWRFAMWFPKIIIAFIFIVIAGAVLLGTCVAEIGGTDGRHIGYITAIENADNLIFDSTIVYVKSNTASTQEDKYCVNDQKVKEDLEKAAASGERVTIHYKNDFFMMKWECNGASTIIVDVVATTLH